MAEEQLPSRGDNHENSAEEPSEGSSSVAGESGLQLKRELGLVSCSALITGAIIGSGIFVSPGQVLETSGSRAMSIIVWGFAGVLSCFGALCYAEMGTMISKSGGDYTFLKAGTPNVFAYLWVFAAQNINYPASSAIKSLVFADYLVALLPTCDNPELVRKLIGSFCIVTAYLSLAFSTKMAARLIVVTTVAKVTACVIIAVGGFVKVAQGQSGQLAAGFEGTETSPSVLALSFYSAFFAYNGWDTVARVTEEVKNPRRNLPLSLVISLGAVIVLYVCINCAYMSMLTRQELLESSAVAMDWGDRVLIGWSQLIPVAVMISTFGSAATANFGISRSTFVAARDGNFPAVASYIQVGTLTPIVSLTWLSVMCLLYLLPGDTGQLINFVSFYNAFFQGMVYVSLLVLRRRWPDTPRPYRVPTVIPVFMVVWSVFLLVAPLVVDPNPELIFGLLGILLGLVFYPLIWFNTSLPGTDKATVLIQLVFNVVPPAQHKD